MIRVLLVDDEPALLEIGKLFLEKSGEMAVETALSAEEALALSGLLSFDVIVSDYEMPGQNGIELLKAVRAQASSLPFLIFTGRGRERVVIEAINNGADFYVQKGGSPSAQFAELAHKIKKAVERHRADENLRLDEQRFEALYALSRLRDEPFETVASYALEEAIRLTRSTSGYLAFVSEDEREMTMYAWSESVLEGCRVSDPPRTFRVESTGLWGEAIRQRRPIITNDYPADNPLKKGLPKGHVPISRHMNAPVFDAGRIVIVAGVGNKPAPYDATDVRQLTLLMDGVWQYLKRRRSEEELKAAHAEMEAACEQLKATEEMLLAQCDELVRHEAKIRESEERFKLAAEGADVGVWDVNLVTGEQVTSERWAMMLGYTPDELAGREDEWKKLVHPDDLPVILRSAQEHFTGKTPIYDVEYRMRCKDGSWKWIHSVARVSERDGEGRPVRMTGIQQDVTETRTYRDKLKEANKKLILLSNVTRHDILNQVTGILGNLSLVREMVSEDSPLQRYFGTIETLTRTIHEQIAFTREYQDVGVEAPRWQRVERVVGRAAAAGLGGIPLAVSVGDLEVYADPMLEKVFLNIFFNAARHAEGVTALAISFSERGGRGVIVVEDNGIGVPAAMKERIFKCGVGRNTGFGLFLVREILEINGMAIAETGEEGRGARFEITVPASSYRTGGAQVP